MKRTLNHACVAALLCGSVIAVGPVFAQAAGAGATTGPGAGTPGARVGAGSTIGPSGTLNGTTTAIVPNTVNGGLNNSITGTGPADTSQTPASQMSQRAQANASAAVNRQFNPAGSSSPSPAANPAPVDTSQLPARQAATGVNGGLTSAPVQ